MTIAPSVKIAIQSFNEAPPRPLPCGRGKAGREARQGEGPEHRRSAWRTLTWPARGPSSTRACARARASAARVGEDARRRSVTGAAVGLLQRSHDGVEVERSRLLPRRELLKAAIWSATRPCIR